MTTAEELDYHLHLITTFLAFETIILGAGECHVADKQVVEEKKS